MPLHETIMERGYESQQSIQIIVLGLQTNASLNDRSES